MQSCHVKLDSLNVETSLNVVLGTNDNPSQAFDEAAAAAAWSIMNESWTSLSRRLGIEASDLWPTSQSGGGGEQENRTLFNAKLYPIFNLSLSKDEMAYLSEYFWLDMISARQQQQQQSGLVAKWRQSVRLSLEQIGAHVNLGKLLDQRRYLFNMASIQLLTDSIIHNRPINFVSLIRNSVRDGYAQHLLNLLDQGTQSS